MLFVCTFSIIQWVIVLCWRASGWLVDVYNYIFMHIFRTSGIQCVYGGAIGGVVGVLIIVMIISGIILFRRKKSNIYTHLVGRMGANKVYTIWRMMISAYPSHILVVIAYQIAMRKRVFQISEHYTQDNLRYYIKKFEYTKKDRLFNGQKKDKNRYNK